MIGKHSITELHPQLYFMQYITSASSHIHNNQQASGLLSVPFYNQGSLPMAPPHPNLA